MQTRASYLPPFFLVIASLLSPAIAMAADTAAPGLGGSLLQLAFGFLLILGLLFVTLWLLKKLSVPRGASGGLIRVVSGAAVGPRERVVVVDVAGKRLVLGVAPGRVDLLTEQALPPEATSSDTEANNHAAMPEFAQWLKRTVAKRK